MNTRSRLKARLSIAHERQQAREAATVSGWGYGLTWLPLNTFGEDFNYDRWLAAQEKQAAAWNAFFDVYSKPRRLLTPQNVDRALASFQQAQLATIEATSESLP